MIDRELSRLLIDDLSYFPAIAIVGPRQVGKTTLAQSLGNALPKPMLYIDLESESDQQKLSDAETYLGSQADKCVIIDEIQLMPRLFPLLRSLIDRKREPARFILLGSASPTLLKQSTESLAGRIAYNELMPFSWSEVKTLVSPTQHWFRGGFPVALLAPDTAKAQRWLANFTYTFVERDLRGMNYQISAQTLTKFMRMLTHVHGGVLNYSDLGRSMDVSVPTIKFYIDLLEGGYYVRTLAPYFINVGKRLVKSPKLYIRDSGLLHSLARIPDYEELLSNPLVGASWEGYVIEEIVKQTTPGSEYYFYRTQVGAECDLLLITPTGKRICIEIKLSNAPTVSRGFYESIRDIQPDAGYVIIPQGEKYPKSKTPDRIPVWVCSLPEFLESELFLY